ncbi:MAG: OmpH family outer membrane protein [Chloroherpetonaceae bacterium]|nr:OmpH family outer membrane protein [Chloroherpetonaceae bacterium]
MRKQLYVALCASLFAGFATEAKSQKIGFIDSQAILDQLPEARDAKRRLETLTLEWQNEIKKRREALEKMARDFQAKEVLYTDEIKQQKRKEMIDADKAIFEYQNQKFGVDGEYFRKQAELMRPIQDKLYSAMKAVAVEEGYDYVFDRASDTLLLYANETHNLTQKVLDRLLASLPERERAGASSPTGDGGSK